MRDHGCSSCKLTFALRSKHPSPISNAPGSGTGLCGTSENGRSATFEEGRTLKPSVVCTEPHLYLQDDRPIVRLLHYFEAHLIQLLCRVVMFPPSVSLHRYPVEPVDARGIIRRHLR